MVGLVILMTIAEISVSFQVKSENFRVSLVRVWGGVGGTGWCLSDQTESEFALIAAVVGKWSFRVQG